jgi:hypothetical protein
MSIQKWFKNKITALSIAFSNVEKNLLNQDGKNLGEDIKQTRRHLQGTLVDSLLHGEVTQEVKNLRWRTYKILKETQSADIIFNGVDENGLPIYTIVKKNAKKGLAKIKIDSFDDYKLELVVDNSEISNSVTEAINDLLKDGIIGGVEYFATNKGDNPIKIKRIAMPRFCIERYTKKLNVRKINKKKKLLEFYISKYTNEYNVNANLFLKEINKVIKNGSHGISFLELDEVSFISNNTAGTNDFLYYSYGNLSFDKIIEFNGHYVIKFFADVNNDGDDILLEYIEPELDKKYKNKESKIKRPKDY